MVRVSLLAYADVQGTSPWYLWRKKRLHLRPNLHYFERKFSNICGRTRGNYMIYLISKTTWLSPYLRCNICGRTGDNSMIFLDRKTIKLIYADVQEATYIIFLNQLTIRLLPCSQTYADLQKATPCHSLTEKRSDYCLTYAVTYADVQEATIWYLWMNKLLDQGSTLRHFWEQVIRSWELFLM